MTETKKQTGKIKQVIGAVVDVVFEDKLPEIFNALEVVKENGEKLILEVEQHTGFNVVRCIAMGLTDGLKRGDAVTDTGVGIQVPVAKKLWGEF